VVADRRNHALRCVSKAGEVSSLAGNGEEGFVDGRGDTARFYWPAGVTLAANDEIVVADFGNHAIRVVTPGGAVRTLAGNGEAGFEDGKGEGARFFYPVGLARDQDGSILVGDLGNNAVRRVTMEGEVSTLAGNGEEGYADGEGAAARFNGPRDVVVDREGTIVVVDMHNGRLQKIVGRQVTTLAGSPEAGTADGAGAGARFKPPSRLALDERGRLLVSECGRVDSLRVVDTSLAPPVWMGPVDALAEAAPNEEKREALARPPLALGWEQARPTFDKPGATPAENGFPLKNAEHEVRLTPTRKTSMTVLPRGRRRRFGQTVVRRRSLATPDPWEAGDCPGGNGGEN
jgi:DNA-binding beta-propeller fold protein YncE